MKLVPLGHGRVPKDNNGPLLVEVVPQLSVEQIFRDYCRGILHPSLPGGMYDPDDVDDDNIQDVDEPEDISELYISAPPQVKLNEPPKDEPDETPKDEPDETPEE